MSAPLLALLALSLKRARTLILTTGLLLALFQVLLVLQNTPSDQFPHAELRPELIEIDNGTAKFDLSLYLEEANGTLRGRWEFNTDLFDAATIRRLHGHWQNLLAGAVADPERRVSELPLMSAAEERQLLVDWNDTAAWIVRWVGNTDLPASFFSETMRISCFSA